MYFFYFLPDEELPFVGLRDDRLLTGDFETDFLDIFKCTELLLERMCLGDWLSATIDFSSVSCGDSDPDLNSIGD